MKKSLKYVGAAILAIGAFALAVIAILIITVVAGLLIDEQTYVEDELALIEITSINLDETRSTLNWEQAENVGTVFFENDISEGIKYNGTFPEGMGEDTGIFDDAIRSELENRGETE